MSYCRLSEGDVYAFQRTDDIYITINCTCGCIEEIDEGSEVIPVTATISIIE